jgi:predicted GTPase
MDRIRVLILGAAGKDFHTFNTMFRDREPYEVVGFTAAQIPGIARRRYPAELAGRLYPEGIPIFPEEELAELVRKLHVDRAVFAYSDVSNQHVMERAAVAVAAGAELLLPSAEKLMLPARVPVVSVCAVRTGCGKSQTTRKAAAILRSWGKRVVVVRHPMPYGDLRRQAVQRFALFEDLKRHECTIEEREEYEQHIAAGSVVFAGVDYAAILSEAEQEADVLLWDGGNNDTPFFRPDLEIVVADPHRAGHELTYWPGSVNFRRASVIVVNKVDTAPEESIERIEQSARRLNPGATLVFAASPAAIQADAGSVRGKRVLVIEDGPTITHGGMAFGAGFVAAGQAGAVEIVDPRPCLVGSLRDTFQAYPHIGHVLPAMGYGDAQIHELEQTVNACDCDLVLVATPIDLGRLIQINKPALRVTYRLEEVGKPDLEAVLSALR